MSDGHDYSSKHKRGKSLMEKLFGSRTRIAPDESEFNHDQQNEMTPPELLRYGQATKQELVDALDYAVRDRERMITDFQVLHQEMQSMETSLFGMAKSLRQNPVIEKNKVEVKLLEKEVQTLNLELQQARRDLNIMKEESMRLRENNVELSQEVHLLRTQDPKLLNFYTTQAQKKLAADISLTKTVEVLRSEIDGIDTVIAAHHRDFSDQLQKLIADMRVVLTDHAELELMKLENDNKVRKLQSQIVKLRNGNTADDFVEDDHDEDWRIHVDSTLDLILRTIRETSTQQPVLHNPPTCVHETSSLSRIGEESFLELVQRSIQPKLQENNQAKDEVQSLKSMLASQHTHLMMATSQLMDKCRAAHTVLAQKIPDQFPIPEIHRVLEDEKLILDKLHLSVQEMSTSVHTPLMRTFDRLMRAFFTLLPALVNIVVESRQELKQRELELKREIADRLKLQGETERRLQEIQASLKTLVIGQLAQ